LVTKLAGMNTPDAILRGSGMAEVACARLLLPYTRVFLFVNQPVIVKHRSLQRPKSD
jgi:hypothetical protein